MVKFLGQAEWYKACQCSRIQNTRYSDLAQMRAQHNGFLGSTETAVKCN